MFKFARILPFAAILGLAACGAPNGAYPTSGAGAGYARGLQSIDWTRVARDAVAGAAMADAMKPRSYGGIGSNRDYTRNWTQTSRRGSCTFFGTGGSICR